MYNVQPFSSSDTIRIECGSGSIVIPFNLWQTFEPKKPFILLDTEFSEKKLGYKLAMGKLIHPSVIYE